MNSAENNATFDVTKPECADSSDATSINGNGLPDSDTIKMFVGQIPKDWDEIKLKEFFEKFGPVYHLNILKDKQAEISRGCCFVTYFHRKDAINAQNALHNIYLMPGLSHPVQMKPADIENRNDRKLFIGMLSKSLNEDDVRSLFNQFGTIENCTILRENGKSKGCAFLTFINRSCAQSAIRKMNQSQIFEGCNKPLVVKFADIGKEKIFKKQEDSNNIEESSSNLNANIKNTDLQPAANKIGIDVLNNLITLLQQPAIIPLLESARVLQQLQKTSSQMPIEQKYTTTTSMSGSVHVQPTVPQTHTIMHSQHQPCLHSNLANPKTYTNSQNLNQGLLLPMATCPSTNPFAQNFNTFGICFPNAIAQLSPNSQMYHGKMVVSTSPTVVTGGVEKSFRGPEGCNLFIYHLPQEFTDMDLYSLFSCFGSILSAKVFIDKQTNLSKCFGFVSYADEASAQSAISGMNGFQIANKRLKVQLKRADLKPYTKPN